MRFSSLLLSALSASLLLIPSIARADVPPPDGEKAVGYSFTVHGLSDKISATDPLVLFAYPCGTSGGAPVDTIAQIKDGASIPVGRRGGECTLYATTKIAWDDFSKTYEDKHTFKDPVLEDFAKTATKCSGAPSPSFIVKSTDSRAEIVEDLDLTELATSKCTVVSRGIPASPKSDDPKTTTPTSPAAGTENGSAPTTSTPASSAPQSSDDGGCSVGGSMGSAGPWMIALAVPIIVFGSRRRKKSNK